MNDEEWPKWQPSPQEWKDRAEKAERERDALREVLEWMDRKGGFGLDVHDRIRAALDAKP